MRNGFGFHTSSFPVRTSGPIRAVKQPELNMITNFHLLLKSMRGVLLPLIHSSSWCSVFDILLSYIYSSNIGPIHIYNYCHATTTATFLFSNNLFFLFLFPFISNKDCVLLTLSSYLQLMFNKSFSLSLSPYLH